MKIEKLSLIGGDSRIEKLAQMLSKDGIKTYIYAMEQSENLKNTENLEICKSLDEAISKSKIIIAPIPLSKDGKNINTPLSKEKISVQQLLEKAKSKTLIAGGISKEIYSMALDTNIIDIMQDEELAILNAIATAEGTIQIAITNTDIILHGSKVLILGFGRIGKVLAKKLQGLSVDVVCAARKQEDMAWIQVYGYTATNINTLDKELSQYDIIINTVPHLVLSREKIENIRKDCLLIDLASAPGGIDREAADEKGIKQIWALAIPGKIAPTTSAQFIKQAIYNNLNKRKEEEK